MSADPPGSTSVQLVLETLGWSRRITLGAAPLVLGRSGDCDVWVPDPNVSRHHCRLLPGPDGQWQVEDLGSQAGTRLNGVPLTAVAPLRPGDLLELAATQARLQPTPAAEGSTHEARNLELLRKTVQELAAAEDLDELLRTIVDRSIVVAAGERGALLLAGQGGVLEAGIARDAEGRDLTPEQVLPRSLPARAWSTGHPVVLTDLQEPDQQTAAGQSAMQIGLRSILCVPLPGREGPAGVLYVDSSRPADSFSAADLSAFESLAVHSGLTIERMRLQAEQARRAAEQRRRLEEENAALRLQLGALDPVGESAPMRRTIEMLRRVAASDATVSLLGETGTGKEVMARYLHRLSARAGGPFVVIDCGAIPEGLIESELFGHEKGAFTGAAASHEGRFRQAAGGTVFLDEIGELPLALQPRLLRVLQEHAVQPVGGRGSVPVDVRVVCATHRDLKRSVAEGKFRQDLYYRIAVLSVPIPALRERSEDILLLAQHFLTRYAAVYGAGLTGFTREAVEAMLAYGWPGNVRELEYRIQRAALLAHPPSVSRHDLDLDADSPAAQRWPDEGKAEWPPITPARAQVVERFERAYLREALRRAQGNVAKAAAASGVTRQNFHHLLRRLGIDWQEFVP